MGDAAWFYRSYWNDEHKFLNFLRKKLPVIPGGGSSFITSLTTTGTSGASTVVAGVLNIPVYGGAVTSLTTVGTSGAATLVAGVLNIPIYSTATPGIDSVLAVGQTLTANRTISGNNFTLTLSQTPLISTNTSASAVSGGYYILKSTPIIPSETSQLNFNLARINSPQTGIDGNEVISFGWNAAPNSTPEVAGKPAMFWSMESNYTPGATLMEWHQEFVTTLGTNRRLSSYTINAINSVTPDIDYYHTVSRFYLKDPATGSVWFTMGDANSAAASMTLATTGYATRWSMNASGMEIQDLGGVGAGRSISIHGFFVYNFGDSSQLVLVDGAQTQINTYGSIPVNIRGAGNTNFYIFGGAANGTLTCTDLPAGNYTMVINLVSSLTTGFAAFEATANTGYTAYLFQTGSAYATAGAVVANMGVVNSTGTGGLFVGCTGGGPIIFCPAANVEQARFDTNGKFVFVGSSTTRAVMNLGVGSAPSSPVDGDIWREDNTNTGIKARVNGVTKTVTLS